MCINTSDLEEEAAQICMMANIYRCASRTCIWLGMGNKTFEFQTQPAATVEPPVVGLSKGSVGSEILTQPTATVESSFVLEPGHEHSNNIVKDIKPTSGETRIAEDVSPDIDPSQHRSRWTCVSMSTIDKLNNADCIAMQLPRLLRP